VHVVLAETRFSLTPVARALRQHSARGLAPALARLTVARACNVPQLVNTLTRLTLPPGRPLLVVEPLRLFAASDLPAYVLHAACETLLAALEGEQNRREVRVLLRARTQFDPGMGQLRARLGGAAVILLGEID
jgi:hypothetical protein